MDDAVYLRDHLNASGGASLIMKYTGKMPTVSKSSDGSGPTTPSFRGFTSLRQRGFGARSPLNSPRFNQAGVEALFQGAAKGAKGVLQRGEKLGINQAVRDAMGEIRKNMQSFNESKYPPRSPMDVLSQEGAAKALAAMERRNRQLASMLDETVANLKTISTSVLEDKAKSLELIEIAAAKVQFVQIYLEDSSMEVPSVEPERAEESRGESSEKQAGDQLQKQKATEAPATPSTPTVDISTLSLDNDTAALKKGEPPLGSPEPDAMDTTSDAVQTDPLKTKVPNQRPAAIPTRSTLAQSSFSWMLDPEPQSSSPSPPAAGRAPPGQHKKRSSNNASRERNAFLFGEVTAETEGRKPPNAEEIFGMESIPKAKGK